MMKLMKTSRLLALLLALLLILGTITGCGSTEPGGEMESDVLSWILRSIPNSGRKSIGRIITRNMSSIRKNLQNTVTLRKKNI